MSKNRIAQRGQPHEEGFVLSEAADPGMLMEFGGSDDIQKHATANGDVEPLMILREQKENDGAGVEDQVPSGDIGTVLMPKKGDIVLVLLGSGSAEHNISLGEALESAGDGTVQSHGTAADAGEENAKQLYAAEALDNSGATSNALLKAYVA